MKIRETAKAIHAFDPFSLAIAGSYAPYLFAVGLEAAFLALVLISLAGSWAVVEALGWNKSRFTWVCILESVPAVLVPVFYPDPLTLALNLVVVFAVSLWSC